MVCRLHSDTILSLTPWSCPLCHGHHHHHRHHHHHHHHAKVTPSQVPQPTYSWKSDTCQLGNPTSYTQIPSYLSHPGHALAEISFTQTLNKYLCATKDMGHQAFERGCQYPNNTVMEKGGIEGQRYVARSRRSGLSNIFLPATSTLGCMH